MEHVRAALEDQVELHPRCLAQDVGTARADLHLLEHVEVEVRGRLQRGHVGDRHAVQGPGVIAVSRALRHEIRLLSGLGAADVHAVDNDARYGLEDDPRVARGRDVLQLIQRDVGLGRLLPRIDDRRRLCHHHELRHTGHHQNGAQGGRSTRYHRHALVQVIGEPRQCDSDLVRPDRHVQEAHFALLVRHAGEAEWSGHVDACARHDRPGAVQGRHIDTAQERLSRRWSASERDERKDRTAYPRRQLPSELSAHLVVLNILKRRHKHG